MSKKTFPALLDQLHNMLLFVKDFCLNKGFHPSTVDKILLATEEALVNVIHHGYSYDPTGKIEIDCQECSHKPGVKICITDYGVPFNPMEKAKKIKNSPHNPIKDTSIGGYGIYLYVEIMDQIEYQRKEDINVLCLIKYL